MTRRRLLPVLLLTVALVGAACSDSSKSGDGKSAAVGPPASAPANVFPGIWPLASQADVDAYAAAGETKYTDPVETARAFAAEYVGMTDPVTIGPASANQGAQEVKVGFRSGEGGTPLPDPKATMRVFLRGVGSNGGPPFTVVSARSPEIVVSSPADYATVASPVRVAGAASAFEGNIEVEIREDGQVAGKALGVGNVAGAGDGKLGPFDNNIFFKAPTKPAGSVLLYETSVASGQGILRATAVRVAF